MKYKRSERLVYMTQHLTTNPNKLIPLTTYVDKFSQAKSSISEDIRVIKDVLSAEGLGVLQTTAGANGGAMFIPKISVERAKKIIADFKIELEANQSTVKIDVKIIDDAAKALTALGFPKVKANKLCETIFTKDPTITVEQLIKQAIKAM